jgi:carbon-monoxide dehydrogenase medium subunit
VIALFRPKEYIRPGSLQEALRLLDELGSDAKVLAGGTDLLVKLPACQWLLDITRLELTYLEQQNGELRIGATTTMDMLTEARVVRERYRAVAEAAKTVGSLGIRSMATVGGNICNASPAADTLPALMAVAAQVKVMGVRGERVMPLEDFVKGVGETDLQVGELLVEVRIPQPPSGSGVAFAKLTRHQTKDDLAVVNAASSVVLDEENRCLDARICLGAVAPQTIRATEAEKSLMGKILSAVAIEEAARIAAAEVSPISDVRGAADYRREMSRVLVKKTLNDAWTRSKENR